MFMLLLISMSIPGWSSTQDLEVRLDEMKSDDGHILYLLFESQEGFPDKPTKSLRQGKVKASEAKDGFVLKDLEFGRYALSVIHDENDNDKLDTNFLGIPKEGVGFSNNPKLLFGAPSYKKCEFAFDDKNSKITIKLVQF